MKTTAKFENGMSIIQLEERYEMTAAIGKGRDRAMEFPSPHIIVT